MTTMTQAMAVLTSQATNEWYTPPAIIERARACLGGIDCDPASNATAQAWIRSCVYYSLDDDDPRHAFARPWTGRVWLNPPFDDTPAWVAHWLKVSEMTAGLLLVNSAPGYAWWERLWREVPVVLLRERLKFVRADGRPGGQAKKGQTIAYRGPDYRAFVRAFGDMGRLVLP